MVSCPITTRPPKTHEEHTPKSFRYFVPISDRAGRRRVRVGAGYSEFGAASAQGIADWQCPMCSRTAPLIEQASKTYKIPVVRHDFPLPMHNWSYQAAVMARYFDTHSKALGNEFRDYIFENQLEVNPQNLRAYAEKFGTAHKVDLPFVLDPGGKLAAQVNADRDLGKAIKLDHTPTVYIVSSRNAGKPYVEVKDNSQLYSTIDAVMKE